MIPHCLQEKHILPQHMDIFHQVCAHVKMLPSGLTCHEVCERLMRFFGSTLDHVKGDFHRRGWRHSWLKFKEYQTVIIDPYPWACASGPIIVTTEGMSPWRWLYEEVE